MDDFREWLSDNLRYFELGFAAIALVAVIFWGARTLLGSGQSQKQTAVASVNEQAKTPEPVTEKKQEVTEDQPVRSTAVSNPLTVAESSITSLVRSYYQSVGEKDIDAVRALVDELAPEDEPAILNSDFEEYVVENVFTKPGLTDKERAVFVEYSYQVNGLDTPVPASSWLYVFQDEEGVWRIKGNALSDSNISSYLDSLAQDQDVLDRMAKVRTEYDQALNTDTDLNSYLNGLGEPSSDVSDETADSSEAEGEETGSPDEETSSEDTQSDGQEAQTQPEEPVQEEHAEEAEEDIEGTYSIVTTDYVNVRDAAGGGEVIGGLDEGVSVRAYGTSGDWTEIRYDGQVAYIYNDYVSAQ